MKKVPEFIHNYGHSCAKQDVFPGFFSDGDGKSVVSCDHERTEPSIC